MLATEQEAKNIIDSRLERAESEQSLRAEVHQCLYVYPSLAGYCKQKAELRLAELGQANLPKQDYAVEQEVAPAVQRAITEMTDTADIVRQLANDFQQAFAEQGEQGLATAVASARQLHGHSPLLLKVIDSFAIASRLERQPSCPAQPKTASLPAKGDKVADVRWQAFIDLMAEFAPSLTPAEQKDALTPKRFKSSARYDEHYFYWLWRAGHLPTRRVSASELAAILGPIAQ